MNPGELRTKHKGPGLLVMVKGQNDKQPGG